MADVKVPAASELVMVTIRLTAAEASALAFVAMAVTPAVDASVVNTADRGLHQLRRAAAAHVR